MSNDFISAGPSLGSGGAFGTESPFPIDDVADEDDFVDAGHDVFCVSMLKIVGSPHPP